MSFDTGALLVFLLASSGLMALDLARKPATGEGATILYGRLAWLASLAHPLAAQIAESWHLQGDLTPFLAFDLITAAFVAAAGANRMPGGRAFLLLVLASSSAMTLGIQLMPGRSSGLGGPLMASALLCTAFIGATVECARAARLDRAVRRPATQLALLSATAAMVQLVVALSQASGTANLPHIGLLLAGAGIIWLALKLMLTAALLSLFTARRSEISDRLSRQLVEQANTLGSDQRVVTQAFYQLAGKTMVTDSAGRILFANADARRFLAYPDTREITLEELFVAVQPTGHQQFRALFERPEQQAELLHIRMTGVECGGQTYHLMQLESLPFDYGMLRSLLVDSRDDAPHEATGLLDHNFAIAAMADGWYRLLAQVDRYAGSGLFWDKLRLLSDSDSEINHLENSMVSASVARGWLHMRNGAGLSVTLRKLKAPDHKLFYRVEMQLVDDVLQARASAPYATAAGRDPAR